MKKLLISAMVFSCALLTTVWIDLDAGADLFVDSHATMVSIDADVDTGTDVDVEADVEANV